MDVVGGGGGRLSCVERFLGGGELLVGLGQAAEGEAAAGGAGEIGFERGFGLGGAMELEIEFAEEFVGGFVDDGRSEFEGKGALFPRRI